MAVERWVTVNDDDKTITGGPDFWDPEAAPDWKPSTSGRLMLETDANAQGYKWPVVDMGDGG